MLKCSLEQLSGEIFKDSIISISALIFPSTVKYLLIIITLLFLIIQYPDLKLPYSNLIL